MRLIILGRDGVINEYHGKGIHSVDDWQLIPGSIEAIARLTQAHFHVIIITNQPGIASGELDFDRLHKIHARLKQELLQWGGRIDALYYCPHGAGDECNCRKPGSGLYRNVAKRLQLSLHNVAAIGDSLADIQAAQEVDARPILVRTGCGRETEQQGDGLQGVEIFDNLGAAVDHLLAEIA